MAQYKDFIPENVALPNTRRIGIYNSKGNRVGQIPLGSLTAPVKSMKLYSFGALSDAHIAYTSAEVDLQRAFSYLNETENVDFTCICGDLTENGTEEELQWYRSIVNSHSPDTPVYAIAGNHERYSTVSSSYLETYTGKPLYYSFTRGNDVFLMCGCYSWAPDGMFTQAYLQWIYETLEANRNKRCFLFEHVFPWGDSGNPREAYVYDLFSGTKGGIFQSLLRHYKNTVLFHGHSHLKYYLQSVDEKANYNDDLGYRSVHIPSVFSPRDIINGAIADSSKDSEGYVVDVYESGIHLRGRDFVKGEFLPIASYWIDTTLQTIPAGTYTDSTGTIKP